MHGLRHIIFNIFTYVPCCYSVTWLISRLDGKSPVAVEVVPPGMVPKATVVGHLFRHSCPWQHGVTWILRPHPFHRSVLRCYEWRSTDTEEVSCTHRYTTSSPRYSSFHCFCGSYELKFSQTAINLNVPFLWVVQKVFGSWFVYTMLKRNVYIGK